MRSNVMTWLGILTSLVFVHQTPAPLYEAPELTTFVDLRPFCNMGLGDEVMDDRKGGWLDQGGNDLGMLPVGMNTFAGVPFDVIDPAANRGRAAIMLRGQDRPYFLAETDWIPVKKQFAVMYMLHGVGWGSQDPTPYAKIVIKYDDETTAEIPLRIGQEANDWHTAKGASGGPLAWVGKNSQVTPIGLHLLTWENPQPKKFVEAIRFKSENRVPIPGILAVTVASKKLEVKGPNTQLREMDFRTVIVSHRARMPLCRLFVPAGGRDITVHRLLPEQAKDLVSLDVLVRLAKIEKPGEVAVTVGGRKFTQKVRMGDYIFRFKIDDAKTIEAVKAGYRDFPITVQVGETMALGEFAFDTNPNVLWAVGGQDKPNGLYGITFAAFFYTSDPKLAKWGHLELPYPGREAPRAVVEEVRAEPLEIKDAGPRGQLCLNGTWKLASGPAEKMPDAYKARVRVPGLWGLAQGLTEEDKRTHSLWYRTEFSVPDQFSRAGRLVLGFGKASYHATVYLNGRKIGVHEGDLDPFEFDVTESVKRDGPNELTVCVEDNYRYFKPITKRLKLDLKDLRAQEGRAFLWTLDSSCGRTDNEGGGSTIKVFENGKELGPGHTRHQEIRDQGAGRHSHWAGSPETLYMSTSDNTDPRTNGRTYEITYNVYVPDRLTLRLPEIRDQNMGFWVGIIGDVTLQARPQMRIEDVVIKTSVREQTITIKTQMPEGFSGNVKHAVWKDGKKVRDLSEGKNSWSDARRWDIDDPYLYILRTDLIDDEGKSIDSTFTPFGFREFWVEGTNFVLNGRKIHIQGDSPSIAYYQVPVENRLYQRTRMQLWRYLNVNLLRLHVSGINCPTFTGTADELGMLVTLEAPFLPWEWIYDSEKDQPRWDRFETIKEQYRQWARRFRNSPSLVSYSLFNEFWSHVNDDPKEVATLTKQLGMLKVLNDVVRKEDPTRLTQLHGSEAYRQHGVPWSKITNMHYQWRDEQTNHWQQEMKGRPLIMGEIAFEGTWSFFSSNLRHEREKQGRDAALDFYWDKINAVSKYITAYVDLYRARDMSGIMPYEILQWAPDPDDPRGQENMPTAFRWPALSGPDQKPEQGAVEGSIKHINWFDPKLPAGPQNPLTDTIGDHFEPQPLPPFQTRPEIIIAVRRAGKPVPGIPVMLYPLDNQGTEPIGCVTDDEGKAWLVLPEGGKYRAVISLPGGSKKCTVQPEPVREFSTVKTVVVNVP